MFGYVMADTASLSKEDFERYRSYYCGLCRSLKRNCGNLSRLTLNYDLTFLSLFLTAYYEDETEAVKKSCMLHPFSKSPSLENGFSDYASYMNVLLCYYNFLDDWQDDKSIVSFAEAKLFEAAEKKAKSLYERQSKAVEEGLSALSRLEKENCLNPDLPASEFGKIMGAIFDFKGNGVLYDFGFALGKIVYIIDAICDLKRDIKKKSYNPLLLFNSADFEDMVNMLMADVVSAYKALDIKRENRLIENILFSGILFKYRLLGRKNRK